MLRKVLVASLMSFAACAPPPDHVVAPAPRAHAAVVAREIDPMPGSVAELEAIAADGNAGPRGLLALERMADILHATAQEPAAATALRRLYARAGERVAPRLRDTLLSIGAFDEADAVSRHLACPALYTYAPGADGANVAAQQLPQDHDRYAWERWESLHPTPIDLDPRKRPKTADSEADTHYVPLYTQCSGGSVDAWLAVAHAHRTHDAHGGPFAVLRAVEAYEHAIRAVQNDPSGPAMKKARLGLGSALHAQERYHAAALALVPALTLCDQTSACAPAEREEAITLLADAVTHLDFEGGPADAPVIARPDIIDTEPRQEVAEQKLRVTIDRAVDPALVPPGSAFLPELLAALGQIFVDMYMFNDALAVFAEMRHRFPDHREMPHVLQAVARTHGNAARTMRPSMAPPRWITTITAWEELESFVAVGSPWRAANASDADALAAATQEASEAPREIADALAALASSMGAAAQGTEKSPVDDATATAYFRRARDVWTIRATAPARAEREAAEAVLERIRQAEVAWLARGAHAKPAHR